MSKYDINCLCGRRISVLDNGRVARCKCGARYRHAYLSNGQDWVDIQLPPGRVKPKGRPDRERRQRARRKPHAVGKPRLSKNARHAMALLLAFAMLVLGSTGCFIIFAWLSMEGIL